MENENFIITIDGPTGTGKSVTAQYLAYKLGCKYYDTGFVIEGKDTGVDVFPNAQFKFYLVSDMSARIARRQQDFLDNGQKFSKEKIAKELKLRDDVEIKKAPAIVKKAKDAIKVDTTNMIVEEQVNYLYRIITNPELNLIQPEGQQPQGN